MGFYYYLEEAVDTMEKCMRPVVSMTNYPNTYPNRMDQFYKHNAEYESQKKLCVLYGSIYIKYNNMKTHV